ncbi:hypothetical protein CS238_05330 [Salmonella enterica]|nr:hypothetical protein [Salmonella enterica]EJC8747809.1 hypothetical protein [Salmonella enterica]HCM1648870.1 hypothetical protein [Salmonella enterica subsp. diarizonae serovar 48:i:z35]
MNEDMRGFMDDWIIEQDQKVIGEKLVDLFIKYRSDEKMLLLFSKIVSGMGINDFSHTVKYLEQKYVEISIHLSTGDKKEIIISVLLQLKKNELLDKHLDEYRMELINAITGFYRLDI